MSSSVVSERACPLCLAYQGSREVVASTQLCGVIQDAFPCSPGHVLVTPLRHVGRLHDLTEQEWLDMNVLVRKVLQEMSVHDGVTVGVNDGAAAGQSIPHVHMHLIPRAWGDVPEPRGGIRMIFPNGDYWSA